MTVNQIVAWNIAWYRREAGLTQQELADRLGWPQNKVSEAERSWSGRRTREFDAQILAMLALALEVPLIALFLPPEDDAGRYIFVADDCDCGSHGRYYGMTELMTLVVMPESDSDTEVMAAYRRRLLGAIGRYMGQDWESEAARWQKRAEGREAVAEYARRLRGIEARLLALQSGISSEAPLIGRLAEAMEAEAAGE